MMFSLTVDLNYPRMETFKFLTVLMCLLSYTQGQNFTCLELRPSSLDHSQPQSSMFFSLETSTEGTYVRGNDILVTITSTPGEFFNAVYLAVQDISANEFIGTWTTPSRDYSRIECFGGPTVISYSSSTSQSSITFTWRLTDSSYTGKFIIKGTVIGNGQNYWKVSSGLFNTATMISCPTPLIFSGGDNGKVVIWEEFSCPGGKMLDCNGIGSGQFYPPGNHSILCSCEEDGFSHTCFLNFTIDGAPADTNPPTVTNCPMSVLSERVATGSSIAVVDWEEPVATDQESVVTVMQSHTPPLALPVGSTVLVNYTFSDQSGNSAGCSFTITVLPADSTPPVFINCPTDIRVPARGPDVSTSAVVWPEPVVVDDISEPVVVTVNFPPGTEFVIGTPVTVVYTATDSAAIANTAECRFTVEVLPFIGSFSLSCPVRATVNITRQGSGFVAVAELPECTDTTTGAELQVNCNVTVRHTFVPGDYGVGCNCTHSSGAVKSCAYVLTFPEPSPPSNTPPNITCPDSSSVRKRLLMNGSTEVTWSNNCTDTEDEQGDLNVMCNVSQPGIFQPGESYIRCYCTDIMGSVDECDFLVTITEPPPPSNTPPNITCPDSSSVGKRLLMNGSIEVTWPNTCTDTEDGQEGLQILCNISQPVIFQPGQSYIGCNCTDTMGNVDECDFLVTITAPTPSNTPPRITCPESSSVITTRLPNGDFNVTWANTCIDTEDGLLESVTCNVSQGTLQRGETYINCSCTDSMGSVDVCDFLVTITDPGSPQPTTDIPSPTENCQIPDLENTIFSCTDGTGGSQTTCSLGCTNNTIKAIPDFGLISCRNSRWEPRILNRLCQRPIVPISRSILINVQVDTSSPDCIQPRNLDNGIKTFFSDIFATALMTFCSSGIQDDICTQNTTVGVSGICLTELGPRRRRQIQGKAVLNVTLNVTSSRDDQFILGVAENVVMGIEDYSNSPPIDLETTEYTATLTPENRQAIWKSNITYNCHSGHAPVGDGYCVLCPPGTYLSDANNACKLCESGSYQDRPGQPNCKKCEFTNDDLPGSAECQKPPEMSPGQDSGRNESILLIAIGIAAVLAIFVVILSIVTLCMCCGVKDERHNKTIMHGQTTYVEDEDTRLRRLEQEAEVALRDYAGRDEADDEDIDIGAQYTQDSYDSPPPTRREQSTDV
ncbi:Hyalin [Holothuria leucospilota]|uniref:Hyalin n=1 Tax=Holothuria leucospilota TaxID=206669 RepID=A0A9Q1H1S4_HOLLE|nr:Hyalin [Holothuria leucospilota]